MDRHVSEPATPEPGKVPLKWSTLALTVDGPGFYEERDGPELILGVRPGAGQYLAAFVCFGFAFGGGLLWWVGLPWLGIPLSLLFAVGGIAAVRFRQRFQVTAGKVRVSVSQFGGSWSHEWDLPGNSACRVHSYRHAEHFPRYRAEIRTDEGWIPLAESLDPARVRQLAFRIAEAAGIECAG